jgi:KUP system potassium uptake protein
VNWGLYVAIVGLVLGFRSSSHLASAYGIAVTATLAIDTILAFVVVRVVWKKPKWLAISGAAAFLVVDLAFFAANTTKILHGGWFPIAMALVAFTLLSTWRKGRRIALKKMAEEDVVTGDFFQRLAMDPPHRVPGTAVYLTALSDGMPRPLVFNLTHNHILHENVILFTTITRAVPIVPDEKRLTITELGHGIVRIVAGYGFMQQPDVPEALKLARDRGKLPIDADGASYFLSSTNLAVSDGPGMWKWRKRLFALMSRNSMHAAQFMRVPKGQLIEIGTPIDI